MAPEQAKKVLAPRTPILPTLAEREDHNLTHQPFRSWCTHCVSARAPDNQHVQAAIEDRQSGFPVVCMDFAHQNKREDEKLLPTLAITDRNTGGMASAPLPSKTAN